MEKISYEARASITRSVNFLPTLQWKLPKHQHLNLLFQRRTVFTGGEDGQVKAWRMPSDDTVAMDEPLSEESSQQIKKRKKQAKSPESEKKARFKPY